MSASDVKVGLVGLGLVSRSHITAYRAHPHATIVAVCDLDETRAKAVALSGGPWPTAMSPVSTPWPYEPPCRVMARPRSRATSCSLRSFVHSLEPAVNRAAASK